MLDADELKDRSFLPWSPFNPEGIKGKSVAVTPTTGMSCTRALPTISLDWEKFEMPVYPKHLKPSDHFGCLGWEKAILPDGQLCYRAISQQRWLFFAPSSWSAQWHDCCNWNEWTVKAQEIYCFNTRKKEN